MNYTAQNLRLSHSTISQFHSCARKLEFRKMFRSGRSDSGLAAECGKALHEAYQTYARTGSADKALFELMFHFPYLVYENATSSQRQGRSLEACISSLDAMLAEVDMTDFEIASFRLPGSDHDVAAIELPFQFNLKGVDLPIPVTYVGKVDLVLWHRRKEKYCVLDIKTTRDYRTSPHQKYKFDTQQVPYGIVLEHLLGKPIDTFDVYYLNCYMDLMQPEVQLLEFEKTQQDISDWAQGLMVDVHQIAFYIKNQWFPRNSNACSAYYGCNFFDICVSRNMQHIMNYIEGPSGDAYVEEPWDAWVEIDLDLGDTK